MTFFDHIFDYLVWGFLLLSAFQVVWVCYCAMASMIKSVQSPAPEEIIRFNLLAKTFRSKYNHVLVICSCHLSIALLWIFPLIIFFVPGLDWPEVFDHKERSVLIYSRIEIVGLVEVRNYLLATGLVVFGAISSFIGVFWILSLRNFLKSVLTSSANKFVAGK